MSSSSQTVVLPDLGEGLTEAEVVEWLVKVGEAVAVDQLIVEVETSKATVTVPTPMAGVVAALHAEPGQVVPVGAPLLSFEVASGQVPGKGGPDLDEPLVGFGPSAASVSARSVRSGSRRRRPHATKPRLAPSPRPTGLQQSPSGRAMASPAVRQLAQTLGVELSNVEGTGLNGLILRTDVERAAGDATSTPKACRRPSTLSPSPAAAKLTRSRREIPEVTVWLDADASGLLSARDLLAQETPGAKNVVLALIASICVRGLVRYPALNGRFDPQSGATVQNQIVNLGIAVQSDRGLVVPVLHDADRVDTRGMCAKVSEMVSRALHGTLEASHLQGGTFTLNNYGGLGVDGSTPIINYPESAILGVGRIMARPWVVGDEMVIRPIVTVSMAYDHRVSDGAYAANFLRFVCEGFESARRVLDD